VLVVRHQSFPQTFECSHTLLNVCEKLVTVRFQIVFFTVVLEFLIHLVSQVLGSIVEARVKHGVAAGGGAS